MSWYLGMPRLALDGLGNTFVRAEASSSSYMRICIYAYLRTYLEVLRPRGITASKVQS